MDVILEAEDLTKEYKGPRLKGKRQDVQALNGVSLEVVRGQTLGVVGESGSGKSTLGRLLIGLEERTSGDIRFQGQELSGQNRRETLANRRRMQIIFQDPYESLNPRLRVGNALAEALKIHTDLGKSSRIKKVKEFLVRVGLHADDYRKFPHQFSGGQRQRVCIARALIVEPTLVVCDEAVSALDVSVQAGILDLLRKLQEELGLTYVFISHDLGVIKNISNDVIVMKSGNIVESGTVDELFENPTSDYTKELIAAAPVVDPRSDRFR